MPEILIKSASALQNCNNKRNYASVQNTKALQL